MAKNLAELCKILVKDVYGELTATVWDTISQHGRITLQTLKSRSGLPERHVQHSLAVLIQQHLVFYTRLSDVNVPPCYEANRTNAYALIRCGKILAIVERRYGSDAAMVMSTALSSGHAQVADLEVAFCTEAKAPASRANGTTHGDEADTSRRFHQALSILIEHGYIHEVKTRTYQAPADREIIVVESVKHRYDLNGAKYTGPKGRVEFNNDVRNQKRKWREEDDTVNPTSYKVSKVRRLNGLTNGHTLHDHDTEVKTLDPDLVLTVNFEKCSVAQRTMHFEHYVGRYYHATTARVYGTLLQLMEKPLHRCRDTWVDDMRISEKVTAEQVLHLLDPHLDLESCIILEDKHFSDNPKRKRLEQVAMHLQIVSEHPQKFLQRVDDLGLGQYTVDFDTLTRTIQSSEIEIVLSARYGHYAGRIVRLLKSKGKLDEKLVSSLGLIRRKDIRAILAPMQEAGMIDTQEIPKDNSRQPNRALYLWYFDQDRVMARVLEDTYKAMARALERIEHQKLQVQNVLEKAERLDVRNNIDELLPQGDRDRLADWRAQEEKLLTQIMRQDDLVALLRDFY